MKTFDKILTEAKEGDKLYIDGYNTLWFAYRPNSGNTISNFDGKFISDKKGDDSYNSTDINKFIKYTKTTKPIKSKGNLKLFPISVYKGKDPEQFDVWEGNEKPSKLKYFIISEGKINVVTFFDTKGEALGWIKSTS